MTKEQGKELSERLTKLASEFRDYDQRGILAANIDAFPAELLLLAHDILKECRVEGC